MTKETCRREHLVRAHLQLQRVSSLPSGQEAWQQAGNHGAGTVAESKFEAERVLTRNDTGF